MIDPDGRLWDSESIAVEALSGVMPTPRSAQDLLEGLVVGGGYVGYGISGRASYVYIDPWNVTPAAMATATAKLIDRSDNFVITALHRKHWEYRVHVSMATALEHVEQAIQKAQANLTDRFRVRAVTPTQLENSKSAGLCEVLSLIDSHRRMVDPELVAKVGNLTGDRFMICGWEPSAHAWFVDTGGLGYNRSRFYLSRDHLINNQPDQDREYGLWLHESFLRVAISNVPLAENVDAIIRSKHSGMQRFTYCRLLVPMTDVHGNRLLLTTSQRDHSIDLGVDARNEFARV